MLLAIPPWAWIEGSFPPAKAKFQTFQYYLSYPKYPPNKENNFNKANPKGLLSIIKKALQLPHCNPTYILIPKKYLIQQIQSEDKHSYISYLRIY